MSDESTMKEQPSQVLKDEHKVILRVIDVLRRLVVRSETQGEFETDALQKCVEFFKLFADACHHAKEEDLLFPAMETRGIPREGGPIGVMLEEHRIARALTQEMQGALELIQNNDPTGRQQFHSAAHQYMELLTQHIFKEDNILFNMGDRFLTQDDQSSLCTQFCEVGCKSFGGKKKEELQKIADELEAQWSS